MKPHEFAKRIVELFERRESIFANKLNVEDWVPTDLDERGKASYLFYLTQLDYAVKSTLLYEGAQRLYRIKPEFFDAQTIHDLPEKKLFELLAKYLRPRYVNEAVFLYIAN